MTKVLIRRNDSFDMAHYHNGKFLPLKKTDFSWIEANEVKQYWTQEQLKKILTQNNLKC